MRFIATATAILSLFIAPLTMADKHRFTDYAKVTQVTPVYRTIKHRVPQEHCWVETVRTEHRRPHSATSTLVGGLIGGAIGHAVGHGRDNKKLGAVVGTVVGMSVGSDVARTHHRDKRHSVSYEDVSRCEVSYTKEFEEKLVGYDVRYRYQGQSYSTRMKKHPGRRIKVAVGVRPVSNY